MNRIGAWALSVGAPGLFVIAFLDSSFLSLPEINDLLIVWMVTKHPGRMLLYAAMATLGSLAGSLVMFYLGKKGGEAMMRRRFKEKQLRRAHELFEKYGFFAIIVPAMLPPPVPFKVFVLLAGVVNMSVLWFSVATIIGRGVRYLGEGLLAVWYGEQAFAFLKANARAASIGLALAVLGAGVLYYVWRRRRQTRAA
jgi:membrane protein YqaA with SNARE-associated domain